MRNPNRLIMEETDLNGVQVLLSALARRPRATPLHVLQHLVIREVNTNGKVFSPCPRLFDQIRGPSLASVRAHLFFFLLRFIKSRLNAVKNSLASRIRFRLLKGFQCFRLKGRIAIRPMKESALRFCGVRSHILAQDPLAAPGLFIHARIVQGTFISGVCAFPFLAVRVGSRGTFKRLPLLDCA